MSSIADPKVASLEAKAKKVDLFLYKILEYVKASEGTFNQDEQDEPIMTLNDQIKIS